jgi:hypothetical protein
LLLEVNGTGSVTDVTDRTLKAAREIQQRIQAQGVFTRSSEVAVV